MTRTTAIVDPGLQPERTDHAWRRTGFSVFAVGGLMLHMHAVSHVLGLILGLPVLFFSIWVYKTGHRRYRHAADVVRRLGVMGRVSRPRCIKIVAVGVITLQVFALALGINDYLH